MTDDVVSLYDFERRQLKEILPDVVDLYESRELESRAEHAEILVELFSEPIDGHEQSYDIGEESWDAIVTALDELDSTRAAWLRSKIATRADAGVQHMSCTTTIPTMTLATGSDPVIPE